MAKHKGLDRVWGWQLDQSCGNMFQRPWARKSNRLIVTHPLLLPFWWDYGPVEAFETEGCHRRREWTERHAIGGQHCSDTKPDAFQSGTAHIRGRASSLRILRTPCLPGPTASASGWDIVQESQALGTGPTACSSCSGPSANSAALKLVCWFVFYFRFFFFSVLWSSIFKR